MGIVPPQGYSLENEALAIGATLDGKYRIVNLLGMGGMGIVYLAENLAIGRTVAVKILRSRARRDAATLARFRQEARAAAAIEHSGIVQVLDMGTTETGQAYMVMERLEGESFAARLKQRGQLSVSETLSVAIEALDAIAAAHAKGIVHRDLKPDNLFLVWRPKWCVKILDFGISRIESEDDLRLTESNVIMGSVLYMPPEQARDARAAGPQADVYAIGAVMYHALSGRPPFVGSNYSEVLSAVLTDVPAPLATLAPSVPVALCDLVDAMLAKDPARRPASAHAVRDALVALAPEPPRPPAAPAEAFAATLPERSDALGETAAASRAPSAVALGETAAAPAPLAATAADTQRPRSAPAVVEPTPVRRPRWWLLVLVVLALAVGIVVVMRGRGADEEEGGARDAGRPVEIDASPDGAVPDVGEPPAEVRSPPDAPPDARVIDAPAMSRDARPVRTTARDAGGGPADVAPVVDAALRRDGFVDFQPVPSAPVPPPP